MIRVYINKMSKIKKIFLASIVIGVIPLQALFADEVNVYSARHYDTDMNLYDEFTRRTSIRVNLIEGGSDALIERIATEGEYSPADILITVDAGRLWRAHKRGIFQKVESEILSNRVPLYLRDEQGFWFGLSKRARVIVYNKNKGLPSFVKDYQDIANPKLRDKVCMRSSSNIYNLSLMASLINALGHSEAETWAKGVVDNFKRSPQGNDTSNIRAVAAGQCDITLANTYYVGRMLGSEDVAQRKMANQLGILFPNQQSRGTHINISGAGITKNAPNLENAVRFLEYLTSEFAQKLFAEGNNEYPIVGETTGAIAQLGTFKEDTISAALLGENQARAVRLYDRAGWR